MSLESYIAFSRLFYSSALRKNKLDAAYCSHSYLVKHWKAQQFWAQVFDDAGMCQSNLFYSSVAYFSLPERNNIKK